jgi:hypothetical protein
MPIITAFSYKTIVISNQTKRMNDLLIMNVYISAFIYLSLINLIKIIVMYVENR